MWKDISHAPKIVDGYPLWVKGNNHGKETAGKHYSWAIWAGDCWIEPHSRNVLTYLTHYMEHSK